MISTGDVVVLALRLALVLILYAFLVTVVRIARGNLAEEPFDPPAPAPAQVAAPTIVAPPRAEPRSTRRAAPTTAGAVRGVLRLRIVAPGESGWSPDQVVELRQPTTLGRAQSADLQLADTTVSTRHAELLPEPDGGWLVRDLGSTNGTFLDGAPVAPGSAYPVAAGQRLRFGAVEVDVLRS